MLLTEIEELRTNLADVDRVVSVVQDVRVASAGLAVQVVPVELAVSVALVVRVAQAALVASVASEVQDVPAAQVVSENQVVPVVLENRVVPENQAVLGVLGNRAVPAVSENREVPDQPDDPAAERAPNHLLVHRAVAAITSGIAAFQVRITDHAVEASKAVAAETMRAPAAPEADPAWVVADIVVAAVAVEVVTVAAVVVAVAVEVEAVAAAAAAGAVDDEVVDRERTKKRNKHHEFDKNLTDHFRARYVRLHRPNDARSGA